MHDPDEDTKTETETVMSTTVSMTKSNQEKTSMSPRSLYKLNKWQSAVSSLLKDKEYVCEIKDVEALVAQGQCLPYCEEQLRVLNEKYRDARKWGRECKRLFLRRNTFSLVEVLVPRTTYRNTQSGLSSSAALLNANSCREQLANLMGVKNTDLIDVAAITKVYKWCELKEKCHLQGVREMNLIKKQQDVGKSLYCLCKQKVRGYMVRCCLCLDYFHATCVRLPCAKYLQNLKENEDRIGDNVPLMAKVLQKILSGEMKFLCGWCLKTKRPNFENVLALNSKNYDGLKIVEKVLLQCLLSRAEQWRERARKVLSNKSVIECLTNIDVEDANLTRTKDQAWKEREVKTTNTELEPGCSDLEADNVTVVGQNCSASSSNDTPIRRNQDDLKDVVVNWTRGHEIGTGRPKLYPTSSSGDVKIAGPGNSTKKGLSSLSASFCFDSTHAAIRRNKKEDDEEKSGYLNPPKVEISSELINEIQNLILEGDLIEFNCEESELLWKAVVATKCIHILNINEITLFLDGEQRKKNLPLRYCSQPINIRYPEKRRRLNHNVKWQDQNYKEDNKESNVTVNDSDTNNGCETSSKSSVDDL